MIRIDDDFFMFQCNCLVMDKDNGIIIYKNRHRTPSGYDEPFSKTYPALRYITYVKDSRGIRAVKPQDHVMMPNKENVVLTIHAADNLHGLEIYVTFIEHGKFVTQKLEDYLDDYGICYIDVDEDNLITDEVIESLYATFKQFLKSYKYNSSIAYLNNNLIFL